MFDRGFDLNAEFLLVLFAAGEFDSNRVIAGEQSVELKLPFGIGNALKFFVAAPVAAQGNDDTGQSFALVWNIGNNFSFNAATLGSKK